MIRYSKEIFEDLSVTAEVGLFDSEVGECYVMFHVTGQCLTFDRQYDLLADSLERLLKLDQFKGYSVVYCKVFYSDIANQKADRRIPGAVCNIQQPPLEGQKVVLMAYLVKGVDVCCDGETCTFIHNGYVHHYAMGLTSASEGSYQQTSDILDRYEGLLEDMDATMEHDCLRTWFYVRDVDFNYSGLVVSRREKFQKMGMDRNTHYIASTGICGTPAPEGSLVQMDAYCVKGLEEGQQKYLYAPTHLNPTYEYGVTFERGTKVSYGDRNHVLISGTASINNKGEVVHVGDVLKQTERMVENVTALLDEAGATFSDLTHMIIYLRDLSDYSVVDRYFREHYPEIPKVIVLAPVCRCQWLIEIECMAVTEASSGFRKF